MKRRSANPHTALVKELDAVLRERIDCFGWTNNTGALRVGKRFIRFGLKGSADWLGLTLDGRFVAFECKTGNAKQTKEQKLFQAAIEAFGGRYLVIGAVEQATAYLDKLDLRSENAVFLHQVRRNFYEASTNLKGKIRGTRSPRKRVRPRTPTKPLSYVS